MKMQLLIVDDEPTILKALERTLSSSFNLTVTESASRALELVESESFDVVLTDERMPEMSGSDLIKEIREKGMLIPCVMLTGYPPTLQAKTELRKNLCLILQKPWKTRTLLDTLSAAAWLGMSEAEA